MCMYVTAAIGTKFPQNAPATTTTQITAGVEAVVVGGTTGEGQLMSWDEHVMLIAHTVHFCAQNGDTMKVRASLSGILA